MTRSDKLVLMIRFFFSVAHMCALGKAATRYVDELEDDFNCELERLTLLGKDSYHDIYKLAYSTLINFFTLLPFFIWRVIVIRLNSWQHRIALGQLSFLTFLLGLLIFSPVIDRQYQQFSLRRAAAAGDTSQVKVFLELGADVNVKGWWSKETPLMLAARQGHTGTVKLLVEKGADGNASFDLWEDRGRKRSPSAGNEAQTLTKRYSALSHAIAGGHAEVVKVLLDVGALAKSENLMSAAEKGQNDIVQLLLERRVNVSAKGEFGFTPLLLATWRGHTKTVTILLEKGADANAKDPFGRTALMRAAKLGHAEAVKALVDHGADVTMEVEKIWVWLL